jgi:hypothetical protein
MARAREDGQGGVFGATAIQRRRRTATRVSLEPLEERLVLATVNAPVLPAADYSSILAMDQQALRANAQARQASVATAAGDPAGPRHPLPKGQSIRFGGTTYRIKVSGSGGVLASTTARKGAAITLFGTDQNSQVTVTLATSTHATGSSYLPITRIDVRTGSLGSFQALGSADLVGTISTLHGPVGSLQFDAIGPRGVIDVEGDLGGLSVAHDVDLGPAGLIHVSQDVTGPVSIGGSLNLSGGQFQINRDLTNSLSVGGNLTIGGGSGLSVGRDNTETQIQGNLTTSSGGTFNIGRDLGTLDVTGNIDTSVGGMVQVGGNLNTLTVEGIIKGKGNQDIAIGLNLGMISVHSGSPNQGGVQSVNLDVGKNIQGVDITQGVFNSLITAGVRIDGGTPKDSFNIGPDGAIAVFDSTITAGVQITNFTISGDVESDRPTNPSGGFTRIVAGVDKNGVYSVGGNIDNFQITGSLIDAVVAASVAPFGGDGELVLKPGTTPGDNGFNTYDAPAGTISGTIGSGSVVVTFPNFTAPPFNRAIDPTIDDAVLPGSINMSYAPSITKSPAPLPKTSTVLGGVISTPHGDDADYAGIFAADTRGVFVGVLPT